MGQHALVAALVLCACDAGAPPPPTPAGRVQAVVAKGPDAKALSGFCDARPQGAAPLRLPAVAGSAPAAPRAPRWLNLWATWCKPCIEELPMIGQWRDAWQAGGANVEVVLLSVDAEPELVDAFRAAHPGTPSTLRIADTGSLATWMQQAGFDSGAGLPLHVFTDADGTPTCLRAGAVLPDHRPLVEHLLGIR